MLWVVTFSVFLPSLTSSSVVWARPDRGENASSPTSSHTRFMSPQHECNHVDAPRRHSTPRGSRRVARPDRAPAPVLMTVRIAYRDPWKKRIGWRPTILAAHDPGAA